MKPLVDLAYDSIRAGAPGLSDATCKVIAASIARKARAVPAPDSGSLSPASGRRGIDARTITDTFHKHGIHGFEDLERDLLALGVGGPSDPTDAMIDAGANAISDARAYSADDRESARAIYAVMLASAPLPPANSKEPG